MALVGIIAVLIVAAWFGKTVFLIRLLENAPDKWAKWIESEERRRLQIMEFVGKSAWGVARFIGWLFRKGDPQ